MSRFGSPVSPGTLLSPLQTVAIQDLDSEDVLPPTLASIAEEPDRQLVKACRVPLCERVDCQLRTHKQYRPRRVSRRRSSQREISPKLVQGGVDGLPALPIDGPFMPVYRSLFHEFFTTVRKVMYKHLAPPPLNAVQRAYANDLKKRYFALATQNSLICLNVVAAAYFQQILRKRGFSRDPTTMTLYGKMVQNIREKLQSIKPEEIDHLMQVILTMVVFDIAIGKRDSIPIHRSGVEQLVTKAGGVHNLRNSLPWVLCLDRVLAIHTGQKALYCGRINRAFHRPVRFPLVYGSFFEEQEMPVDIANFCEDICRAIELMEGQKIPFIVPQAAIADIPDCHYYYFLRSQIEDEFVYLNSEYWTLRGKFKCVLLAAKIVEYVVLFDNYIVTNTAILADRIREEIEEIEDVEEEWKGMLDAFHWVLFVLQILPDMWSSKRWAFSLLEESMARRYVLYGSWPRMWRETEIQNLRKFVWSETVLDPIAVRVCRRIEGSDESDDEKDEDEDETEEEEMSTNDE